MDQRMGYITGHIDHVDADIVLGWIANTVRPERLEQVVCRGDAGSLMFHACLPRLDVSAALSLQGRFGFVIPTEAVRGLGSVLRFTDRGGTCLAGGEAVRLPPPADTPQAERFTWVVLHIQKTAGTSLRLALTNSLRPSDSLFLYPDGVIGLSAAELGQLSSVQRSWPRLVMGHVPYRIADLLPGPVAYATFLREPEARLRSHYAHHARAGTTFRIDQAALPTWVVAQHALTYEFDNLMTRMIAGVSADSVPIRCVSEAHVEIALANIRADFRFVGLVGLMNEHCSILAGLMDLPLIAPAIVNVRPPDYVADENAIDWADAMHHNRFDVMLYERVQAEGMCGRDLWEARRCLV